MRIDRLWLTDYRSFPQADLSPAPDGLTVLVGANGQGKTNLLEAMGYLATLSSFRGSPREALVREGTDRAVVRAEATRAGRALLVEAELPVRGRDRVLVNRQPLRRSRDLLGALQVTVFSPDDLALVKGGPAERRRFLDDALVAVRPSLDPLRSDVERILRQRGALLKQAGGRATADVETTLDVWDAQLARAGGSLVAHRESLLARLAPEVAKAYAALGGGADGPTLAYVASWTGDLGRALAGARASDLRRGVTTLGPHRDDVAIGLGSLPSRTHGSQGEQRSLALALRLATHALVAEESGEAPVLLLDDVFSELDEGRSISLLANLPPGQAILSTTGPLPAGAEVKLVAEVTSGRVVGSSGPSPVHRAQ
ncbi:MAG: DNA replication/repair protein RecF [Acidimicrobiales bacterium]